MQPRETELAPADTAQAPASGSNGQSAAPTQPKRRTTITTPTGNWALGKTIGAGSMGKVKLAKNIETGEQVIISLSFASFRSSYPALPAIPYRCGSRA
jgi:serine/threonine protein kinase